jgi:hypothetical protein
MRDHIVPHAIFYVTNNHTELNLMMQWQEKFSFVPLIKYNYTPSPEELKSAQSNFDKLHDFKGQVISTYGMLNVHGPDKIIEVVAINSLSNYLIEISRLDDIAKVFGWTVFITMNPDFGTSLL